MLFYINYFIYFSKTTHYYMYLYNSNFYLNSKINCIEVKNLVLLINIFKRDMNFFLLNNNLMSVYSLNNIDLTKEYKTKQSVNNEVFIESTLFKNLKIDFINSKSWNNTIVTEHLYKFNSLSFFFSTDNLYNADTIIFNKKFSYFLLLLGAGWHHIVGKNRIRSSIVQLSSSVSSWGGMRQFGILSITYLWKFWSNVFMLIFNLSFYNINIFTFSRIYFKKIVDYSNWILWPYSFFFWKFFNKFFFYKFLQIGFNTKKLLGFFNRFLNGLVFITDSHYHKFLISYCKKINILNIALIDLYSEPWSSSYPIFCRVTINNQYLFLNIFFKIRISGLNLFFFFKKNFLFLLRIISFLNTLYFVSLN